MTKQKHANDKKTEVNANQILKMLDTDALAEFALQTNVDYHARKLQGLELFALHLQGVLLYGDRLSLAAMKDYYSSDYFSSMACHIAGETISKNAISKRFKSITPDYYKLIYENARQNWSPILEKHQKDVIPGLHLEAVDSSIVTQTTKILLSGIRAGGHGGGEDGRKGVKYTMIYDGVDTSYAIAHTAPRYADEDNAMGEAILSMVRKDSTTKTPSIYAFDRGVKGSQLISDFKSEGLRFVGRLNNNRRLYVTGDSDAPVGELPEGATLISDQKVRIYGSKSHHTPLPQEFRVVKVDLGHPIGTRPGKKGREADTVLTLITDEIKLSVSELLEIYRFRWTIEVFFKFLKQNLDFSHLLSGSKNGLTVLLYMTLIEALLLKTYCVLNACGPKLATIRIFLQLGKGMMAYIKETDEAKHHKRRHSKQSQVVDAQQP